MIEIETVAADARIVMDVEVGKVVAWLSADGTIDSARARASKVEIPRCELPVDELAEEMVKRASQAAEKVGLRPVRAVFWPGSVPPAGPAAVGVLFVPASKEERRPTFGIEQRFVELEPVVRALAAANPIYDTMCCFFCHSLAPVPAANRGPAWEDSSEVHEEGCPWWMARKLLGLPAWPTDDEMDQ